MAIDDENQPDKKAVECPAEATLQVISGRWKLLILRDLVGGTKRFGELARALKGVSARTLTKQLRELEADGVVRREIHPGVPLRVDYSLTPLGEHLKPALFAMHEWGDGFEKGTPQ